MKTKVISASYFKDLENRMNEFFNNNPNIEIISVLQTGTSSFIAVTIIYKEIIKNKTL